MQRILVLTDVRGWALDHVFQAVQPILEPRFAITYLTAGELLSRLGTGPIVRRLPIPLRLVGSDGFFRSFDGIFAFYSLLLNHLHPRARDSAACGVHCHYEFTDNRSPETLTSTLESPSSIFLERLGKNRLIAVPSRRLVSILEGCGLRVRLVPYPVDPTVFFPAPVQGNRGPLRLGWCQSESNHTFKRRIAEIRRICAELPKVELVEIPQDRPITDKSEMRGWYNSLDCYVCFSICEGGPMPVLEAMACGVPCISTPVGHVPEIIQHGTNGWMVNTEPDLKITLRCLANDRGMLVHAGAKAREAILARRTPECIAPYWISFFDEMVSPF